MDYQINYSTFELKPEKKSFLKEYEADLGVTRLFINLELKNFGTQEKAKSLFKQLVEILENALTQKTEVKLYTRFEESLKNLNESLSLNFTGEINACVAILDDGQLHLTKTGSAEGYILRKNRFFEITKDLYQKDAGEKPFTNIASGALEVGDKIIFSSKRLLRYTSQTEINSIFALGDFQKSLRELQENISLDETGDVLVNGFNLLTEQPIEQQDLNTLLKPRKPALDLVFAVSSANTAKFIRRAGAILQTGVSRLFKLKKGTPTSPEQKRKLMLGGGIAILILLICSIAFSSYNHARNQNLQQYRNLLLEAQNNLELAKTQGIAGNRELAALNLEKAEKNTLEVRVSGYLLSDALKMLEQIGLQKEQLDNILRVAQPKVFADLSSLDSKLHLTHLLRKDDAFYTFSPTILYGPILDNTPNAFEKHPFPNGETVVDGTYFKDQDCLVFLTGSDKVLEFKNNKFAFIDTVDNNWKGGKEIKEYAGRKYLYLLDSAGSQIWRYERTNQKYLSAQAYNTSNLDYKDAVSFAMDGGMYVLKQSGEVLRTYAKKFMPFSVKGSPSIPLSGLTQNTRIYTNENLRRIYILDSANRRVLIYRKETFENPVAMVYERQYLFEKEQDINDFYIDDEEKYLYLVSDKQIFEVGM
ncbi:hypothetical protein COT40_01865 [Candidatus Peregrinibacteria bacterium CG08_land_8_20_14_0_20_41_10]|nr:MAG: hypothetical protein COT40_01865 [Candidatus Peregrinibacteria bacterium CG08_land_8_20_14_0_20_41_10]